METSLLEYMMIVLLCASLWLDTRYPCHSFSQRC